MTNEIHNQIIQNVSNAIQSIIRAERGNKLYEARRKQFSQEMISNKIGVASDDCVARSYRILVAKFNINNHIIEDAQFVMDMNLSAIR